PSLSTQGYCRGGCSVSGLVELVSPEALGSSGFAGGGVVVVSDSEVELELEPLIVGSVVEGSVVEPGVPLADSLEDSLEAG
ncbi:MAG: hypothetical protein ACRETX_02180, partial [Steroidobacteraceae bacterium]